MEQGKDVIAVDKNGRVHCYQLKSGNINNKVWGEIKSEIDDLVELPPKHPSLPAKVEEWDAYLVTNGTFANPVARTIHDYAEAKKDRGHRPLKTIVRDELVQDFTEHFGDFMPVEIQDCNGFSTFTTMMANTTSPARSLSDISNRSLQVIQLARARGRPKRYAPR